MEGDDSLNPMVHVSDFKYSSNNMQDFENLTMVGFRQSRQQQRYSCSNKAIVTDIDSKQAFAANAINLSTGGIALSIKTEEGICFKDIQIEIFDSASLKSFLARGEVRYVREASPYLVIGVEFKEISRLSIRRIEDFLITAEEYS